MDFLKRLYDRYETDKFLWVASRFFDKTGRRIKFQRIRGMFEDTGDAVDWS
jgi:hypothetical protein